MKPSRLEATIAILALLAAAFAVLDALTR